MRNAPNQRPRGCLHSAGGWDLIPSFDIPSFDRPCAPRPVPVAESHVIPHGVREPSRIILVFRRVMTAFRQSIVFVDDSSRQFSPFGSFYCDWTRSHVPAGL